MTDNWNHDIGTVLWFGGTLDFLLAEVPRLLNPNIKEAGVSGLNIQQSGIVGSAFDFFIIYAGLRLASK